MSKFNFRQRTIPVDISHILGNLITVIFDYQNSSQTLENTKFVASELSLTLSLVLHFPIAFHEP